MRGHRAQVPQPGAPPALALASRRSRDWLRLTADAALIALAASLLVVGALVVLLDLQLRPILSGSMRPTIEPGDLVVTAPVSVTSLKAGDVIALYPPGQSEAVLHRLQSVTTRDGDIWITTRGDANTVDDAWGLVRLNGDVARRLTATVPRIGYIPIWTQGARGPLLVAAGALLGFPLLLSAARAAMSRLRSRPPTATAGKAEAQPTDASRCKYGPSGS